MNFPLAQSHRLVRRPRVLRGGKAPLYWKRELSCLTERLGSMPRRCDWLREIAETHPRLIAQPLFGTSLAAITSSGAAQFDKSNESTEPATRSTSPHLAGNRDKQIAFEQTIRSKQRQVQPPNPSRVKNTPAIEKVSQLPRRAADSLLRTTNTAANTLHDIENPITNLSLPHSRPSSAPLSSPPNSTHSEWLQLVAERAAKRWVSNSVFPSTRQSSSPPVARNPKKNSPASPAITLSQGSNAPPSESQATIEMSILRSLHDEWLLPLAGQQASPHLLASLLNHPSMPNERGRLQKIHSRNEKSNGPGSEPRGLASSPDRGGKEQQSFTDRSHISRPLERMFERQAQTPMAEPDIRFPAEWESTINSEERQHGASPNFAPTALTPALSPLLPAASAGSSVMPVAADTARRFAWRDEVEQQQTDLSVLAAQVKRILDEEARRHGIDV